MRPQRPAAFSGYSVDAQTGDLLWKHDTHGSIWGCLLLAGQHLYAGNVQGTMTVLGAGRQKCLLAEIVIDEPLYSRPAIVGDSMYLASARYLYLIHSRERESKRVTTR